MDIEVSVELSDGQRLAARGRVRPGITCQEAAERLWRELAGRPEIRSLVVSPAKRRPGEQTSREILELSGGAL